MIISHKHRFIFIKTNKTAGTSIEIALSKYCGPEDIITPFALEDEAIRSELGFRRPQNYLRPLKEYTARDWARFGLRCMRFKKSPWIGKYYAHMPAWEVRPLVTQEIWDGYFKFCVERNPWDRLISLYYYVCSDEPRPTISDFIDNYYEPNQLKQWGYNSYTVSSKVIVDKICLYENLEEELEAVRLRLGFPEPLILPKAKTRFRKDRRDYRDILSEPEIKKIGDMFREEIDLLGY